MHGLDAQATQLAHALLRSGQVVYVEMERGSRHVHEQVPTEHIGVAREDADRSARMTRKVYDPRVEPVGREVLPVLQEHVRLEHFEVRARPGDLGQQAGGPYHEPEHGSMPVGPVLPADAHVSAPHHLSISAMNRNRGMVSPAKMRAVARMIEIAMGQGDEAQFTGPATCCRKFGVELVPLAREARVDEDVTALNIDEIAVRAQVDPADSAGHAVHILARGYHHSRTRDGSIHESAPRARGPALFENPKAKVPAHAMRCVAGDQRPYTSSAVTLMVRHWIPSGLKVTELPPGSLPQGCAPRRRA